ncbi:MAG: ATP-binding protein [Myxococcota bacterium]
MHTRRIAIGFVLGFVIGCSDVLMFRVLGVHMLWQGSDATGALVAFFSVSFGTLGAVIAHTLEQRRTIQHQYDQLERARAVAQQQERLAALGRMSAGVAHEVRNPLGVIRCSASMIREDLALDEPPDPAGTRKAAGFIVEEVDRLDDLVRRLLDVARPLQANLTTFDLDKVVDDVLAMHVGHPIPIERQIAQGIQIRADRDLVIQALRNLVANALAFAESRVLVRITQGASRVVISVHDDGPGVPHHERSEVFEPFHTTRPDGTGLGLPMALKIAEVHGGRLELVDGEGLGPEGQGATFRMEIGR